MALKKASEYYKEYLQKNTKFYSDVIAKDVVLQSMVKQIEAKIEEVINNRKSLANIEVNLNVDGLVGLNDDDVDKRLRILKVYLELLGYSKVAINKQKLQVKISI